MCIKTLSPVLLATLIFFGTVSDISAQNFQSIEKKAIRFFRKGNLVKARDQFQLLYDGGYRLNSTASYLAKCHMDLHEYSEAQKVFNKLSDLDDENVYLYALANILSENFKRADSLIKLLNNTTLFDLDQAILAISKAEKYYNESKGYYVQNLGASINSRDWEYNAIMYNEYNELIFTKRTEASEEVDADGLAYEKIFYTKLDSANGGEWTAAVPLNMDENRDDTHVATVQIYRDGEKMISYRNGDLYSHTLKDGRWQKDEGLFIKGIDGNNTHCFVTDDENTVFFASDFQSEGEQLDLFVIQKDQYGYWRSPEPLRELNTPYDEDSPFLAQNGVLYFSSRGHDTMGGYDIFQTSYDSISQKWNEPKNLGYPINTVAEDTYFTIDGKLGYLSSTRTGGFGSLDVYRVFLFNKVSVAGQLLDSASNPIADAEVNIKYDSTNLRTYTDGNGAYELLVPIYKEMKVTFEKDTRVLHEGEYVAHVYFKDKNDNSFNFYFENTELAQIGAGAAASNVKHINVKVRNDYAENLIIEKVPKREELVWADSVNSADSLIYVKDFLARNDTIQLIKETVSVTSTNLNINDMVIIKKIQSKDKSTASKEELKINSKLYTVQILAMTIPNKPDPNYFRNLEPRSIVLNVEGKDGFNRFYLGAHETKRDAVKAMRELRENGYEDAFIRKIKKYKEL
ncbi:hypothetical protein [Ekhidna sp.]|uniref:hypothetical protein n=1 Tax=Ekhidna sp. TaxID=2608089 RepID=UPI003B50936D